MNYYVTGHGIGPGTIPKNLVIDSVTYCGMKLIIESVTYLSIDELKKYEIYRYCPKCKKRYLDEPSLSRADNKTHICPTCGTAEAIKEYIEGRNK